MSKSITGAAQIVNTLIKHNVKNVFGISGGSIMPVIDQFYRNRGCFELARPLETT